MKNEQSTEWILVRKGDMEGLYLAEMSRWGCKEYRIEEGATEQEWWNRRVIRMREANLEESPEETRFWVQLGTETHLIRAAVGTTRREMEKILESRFRKHDLRVGEEYETIPRER
jgi:hypothetical protein